MATLILIVLFFMAIFVAAWIVWEIGKRNAEKAKQYSRVYELIQGLLCMPVTDSNYDLITGWIELLGQLKHKDRERTEVLSCEFWCKYEGIRLERLSEDEFSAESVLGE